MSQLRIMDLRRIMTILLILFQRVELGTENKALSKRFSACSIMVELVELFCVLIKLGLSIIVFAIISYQLCYEIY